MEFDGRCACSRKQVRFVAMCRWWRMQLRPTHTRDTNVIAAPCTLIHSLLHVFYSSSPVFFLSSSFAFFFTQITSLLFPCVNLCVTNITISKSTHTNFTSPPPPAPFGPNNAIRHGWNHRANATILCDAEEARECTLTLEGRHVCRQQFGNKSDRRR